MWGTRINLYHRKGGIRQERVARGGEGRSRQEEVRRGEGRVKMKPWSFKAYKTSQWFLFPKVNPRLCEKDYLSDCVTFFQYR